MESNIDGTKEGSWAPAAIFAIVSLSFWLAYGSGRLPIRLRRYCNSKKIYFRRKFGLRDDSRYEMAGGHGAQQKYKRQG